MKEISVVLEPGIYKVVKYDSTLNVYITLFIEIDESIEYISLECELEKRIGDSQSIFSIDRWGK